MAFNDNTNRSSGLEIPSDIVNGNHNTTAAAYPSALVPIGPKVTARTVKLPALVIIEDTREQNPLTAEFIRVGESGEFPAFQVVRDTLHTGDYSVRGLESSICFERKSVDDLVQTLNPATGNYQPDWSREWKRFNRELMRMRFYNRRSILCEGRASDIINHNYRSLISPSSILGMLRAIESEHDVRVHFCGSRMAMARRIVSEAAEYFKLRFKKYYRPGDSLRGPTETTGEGIGNGVQ